MSKNKKYPTTATAKHATGGISRRAPSLSCGLLGNLFPAFRGHAFSAGLAAHAPRCNGGGILAIIRHLVLYLASGDPRDHDGALVGVGRAFFALGPLGHCW